MTTPNNELQEKDFIHEEYSKNPFPFWIWLVIFTLIVALLWGGNSWYFGTMDKVFAKSPFLRVTNREMSLFLWQNPQYMRINSKNKDAYLTGFQYVDNVSTFTDKADEFVVAPPQVIFLYHTWKRLVSDEFTPRPIALNEFERFLNHSLEWTPQYWSKAPADYVALVNKLPSMNADNATTLPLNVIPKDVQIAFQGWKNYFIEGDAINAVQPTYGQMGDFLRGHLNYARNFWRNIFIDTTPDYLKSYTDGGYNPKDPIANNNLETMLKVAFYNWQKSLPVSEAPRTVPIAPELKQPNPTPSASSSLPKFTK